MKNQTEISNKSIARHTPKTWKVRESGHPDIEGSLWIDSNESIKPALAFGKDNARLIAAAPDLLEALKNLRQMVVDFNSKQKSGINMCGDIRLHEADKAIDKADGK